MIRCFYHKEETVNFFISYLCEARLVSGDTIHHQEPKTALAASGFAYVYLLDAVSVQQIHVAKQRKSCDKWVPVTTAWRVLRLRKEERPPIWRVAANVLNRKSRAADKGWSSSLGLGEVLTTPHSKNVSCYETFIQ
jgi:hypothetical protein